ncbi:GGDEF domain-containing protein, partial [Azohydromonas sediminis]|uniref:GGDEF domain-containing protein n=1 Tax=Azohydromonas sediminis TaxID=2259674 RepID=UPI001F41061F
AALCGGSSLATARSLNACPYRANSFSVIVPGPTKCGGQAGCGFMGDALRAPASLPWTTLSRCPPRRPSPTSSTASHHHLHEPGTQRRPSSIGVTTILTRGVFIDIAAAAMCNFTLVALLMVRLVKRLQAMSLRDALTGLHNRRALDADLQCESGRARDAAGLRSRCWRSTSTTSSRSTTGTATLPAMRC